MSFCTVNNDFTSFLTKNWKKFLFFWIILDNYVSGSWKSCETFAQEKHGVCSKAHQLFSVRSLATSTEKILALFRNSTRVLIWGFLFLIDVLLPRPHMCTLQHEKFRVGTVVRVFRVVFQWF